MKEIVIRLICVDLDGPSNWVYGENLVQAYLGDQNVSEALVRLWNAWWDEVDPHPFGSEGQTLHNQQRLGLLNDMNNVPCIWIDAGESYGFKDFAVTLVDVYKLPFVCIEPRPANKDEV